MKDEPQAPSAAHWPDASLWPAEDAPPVEWARFYRDRMGWVVVPTASPRDVLSHAWGIAVRETAEYALEAHGSVEAEVSEAVRDLIWDRAREAAEAGLGRPIGYIFTRWMKTVGGAADVTDDMLRDAWEPDESSRGPRAEADRRGIAVLPGRSSMGLSVCLVDVDVGHGDSPAGDMDGPWGWGLPGPKASTPRGGLHTLLLSTGKETASADLGPGIDVVASGTPIPVPAGSATPGRRWLRTDPPVVAPDALRRRGRKKAPPRPQAGQPAERDAGEDHDEDGQGARVVSSPTGDGSRNRDAGVLVGVLARPRSCPMDFVRACLELLAEHMAGRDAREDDMRAEMDRWRRLLTRGPRDAEFAAEVMETWLEVRGDGTRMRTTPAKFCASVWRVCDRREDGRAGEEDLGVGPSVGWWPPSLGPVPEPPAPTAAPQTETQHAPPDAAPQAVPVPFPPPPPEVAQAAAQASRVEAPAWRGGVDPRVYGFSLDEDYSDRDLQRDLSRTPVDIAAVVPAVDFVTGMPSTSPDLLTPPVRMGWGHPLAEAKRGIAAGEFLAVGASSAGAGKTTFLAWLASGLGIQTAYRLLGVDGYGDRPIVFPVWVTEMPKKMELYGRLLSSYLGFDRGCLDAGTEAANSPGVRAMAARLGMSPEEVVAKARAMEALHGNDERFPLCVARRHVIRRIKPSKLPRQSRRGGVAVHHRMGPDLVDHVADAVEAWRAQLAAMAGVPTDQVLPVVILDPVQRFAGESEKAAIDAILTAANEVLCEELECVVVTTNDTTKKAAGGVTVDHFLSAEAPGLMADVFSGSQGIVHHASDVICVHPERGDPARPGHVRQWVRLLRSRGGGESQQAFPFEWDKTLGRLAAGAPEQLRPPPETDDGRGRANGGGGARQTTAAPRLDPDATYRLHKAGARHRGPPGDLPEDEGAAFTVLAKEAVTLDGRAPPHPEKNRWWPDVVVSGRAAAVILDRMTARHEKVSGA